MHVGLHVRLSCQGTMSHWSQQVSLPSVCTTRHVALRLDQHFLGGLIAGDRNLRRHYVHMARHSISARSEGGNAPSRAGPERGPMGKLATTCPQSKLHALPVRLTVWLAQVECVQRQRHNRPESSVEGSLQPRKMREQQPKAEGRTPTPRGIRFKHTYQVVTIPGSLGGLEGAERDSFAIFQKVNT